jgi:hypothetical protein
MNLATYGRANRVFVLMVDSIPGLVCTITVGGIVNQQSLDNTGRPFEELTDWHPLVHADDLALYMNLALVMTRWMRSIEIRIQQAIDDYPTEAQVARDAGFDGMQIQAGFGASRGSARNVRPLLAIRSS